MFLPETECSVLRRKIKKARMVQLYKIKYIKPAIEPLTVLLAKPNTIYPECPIEE